MKLIILYGNPLKIIFMYKQKLIVITEYYIPHKKQTNEIN